LTHDFHQTFGKHEVFNESNGQEPYTHLTDSPHEDIFRHRVLTVDHTLSLTNSPYDRSPLLRDYLPFTAPLRTYFI
jgi:glucuronate isomerase